METPDQTARVTEHDRENERVRREIADAQLAAYTEVLKWALGAFGSSWIPSHRHFLVDRDEEARVRYTDERPISAATVYTVKNEEGEARHFTVENGRVVEHESYEAGFGPMLLEPHPTHGFEHRGQWCRIHRYSLCFAPYDLYTPKAAEQLAALRVERERRKAQREDKKWAEENPLWAQAGFTGREGDPGWEATKG